MADHSKCRELAKQEVRTVPTGKYRYSALTINGRLEKPEEHYWRRVRETMPPFFWNRIRQDVHHRCEWCNEPLIEEKKNGN